LFVFWTGILWSPDSRDALIELSRFLRSGRRFDAEERLIQKLPHDFAAKVVWGSRYPHHDATSAWDAMAQLRSANVPETLIARMMGQNAANQFDVEPIRQTAA
jgi:predicted TIM-barrel fold metal-dependent hydrolase